MTFKFNDLMAKEEEQILEPFSDLETHFTESKEACIVNVEAGEKEVEENNTEEVNGDNPSDWPDFLFSWQDFVPDSYKTHYRPKDAPLPSLLSILPDVSEDLPQGGVWFNFVFGDWWFTEPIEPIDELVDVKPTFPCAKCGLRLQYDWQVSRHYIDTHLGPSTKQEETSKVPSPPPEDLLPPKVTTPPPPPPPAVTKPPPPPSEVQPELTVAPFPLLYDWRWQDFVPESWDQDFLPSIALFLYDQLEIEEEKLPTTPPTTPPPPSPPPRRPKFELKVAVPVLKQSKFYCNTCKLIICNTCFTRRCASHSVDFKGIAKFGCGAC